jgi:hypothetical protein
VGLDSLKKVTAQEGVCLILGHSECQQEVGLLGTLVPPTRQRPLSGFAICLIANALFSPHRVFSQSERSHHSTSAAERHRVGEAPPCDRESIMVALI